MRKACACDRLFQKCTQHRRGAFQILDGFKQRHHRQQTHDPLRIGPQQSRFTRQKVNHQQIREAPCHAHDQSPDTAFTKVGDIVREHTVTTQDGIRLGTC